MNRREIIGYDLAALRSPIESFPPRRSPPVLSPDAFDRCQLVRDALESVRHAVPRDLARDVAYYLDRVQEPELALDVLVDGVIEDRTLLALDEFERIRDAMEQCGRVGDRRLDWLEEHGLRPLATSEDDDD